MTLATSSPSITCDTIHDVLAFIVLNATLRHCTSRLVYKAEKAATEAAAKRVAAEHRSKVGRAGPRLDRRALNPAFAKPPAAPTGMD
jgi:hypothetical protein